MGLLSNIVKGVKKVAINAAANITTAVQKPVQYVTATAKDLKSSKPTNAQNLVTKTTSQPLGTQIKDIVKTTGGAAAAVVGVGAAAKIPTATKIVSGASKAAATIIKPVAKSVAKTAADNPVKTGALVLAAPSAATLLLSSEKARETTSKAIGNAVTGKVGSDLGNVLEGKSSLLDFAKEHPVASGTAILGSGLIVGKALGTAGAIAAANLLDNEQTIIKEQSTTKNETQLPTANNLSQTPAATSPQTAETQRIVTTSSRSTKKRRKKAITREKNISQRVNVLVHNTGTRNTNYIKRAIVNKI